VEQDTLLRPGVRHRASRLRGLAISKPDLARKRLVELAANEARRLPRTLPTADLARCVSLEVFYVFHLDAGIRSSFITAEAYRRYVDAAPSPTTVLLAELSASPILFPAVHSWLVPLRDIAGLDGRSISTALRLGYSPPLVVFILSLSKLLAAWITVRTPRAVDAVPKEHKRWDPSGLPDGRTELIDADIPRSTLGSIEWKP